MGRVVALDYGRRRIGVAVSDPTRTIASPHTTIEASKRLEQPPPALVALIDELDPAIIVVGIPLQMDGSEGEMAREARTFARAVERQTGRPVTEWDERLSTTRAEREIRSFDLPASRKRDKGLSDRIAAALLLRSYLDRSTGNAIQGEDEPT